LRLADKSWTNRDKAAGGDMTVRSRPGEGVRIEVRAPVSAEAQREEGLP
jgi:hypothetical protein